MSEGEDARRQPASSSTAQQPMSFDEFAAKFGKGGDAYVRGHPKVEPVAFGSAESYAGSFQITERT